MCLVVRFIEIIDVVGLVDALNASPTRAANLKHKIYYFLSLITDTNDNYRLNDSNDGYHNICSSEIKKVLGSKDFYVIRELLLNPNDPIIEIDNSWHNPNGKNSNELQDLVGTVWQLTNDEYINGSYRYIIMKGGSYFKPSGSWWYVQSGPRELHHRQYLLRVSPGFERNATVGFRCVK